MAESSATSMSAEIEMRDLLARRAGQQAAIAALGQRALVERDLQALMDEVASTIARVLDIEYCKILELLPDRSGLLLRAGVGWRDGLVGVAVIPIGLNSQAGYSLRSDEPIIVRDLRTETRFNGPSLLIEHGVVAGISCIIRTDAGVQYGVLGAHSTAPREFTYDDVNFLQAVANLLAASVQRHSAEDAMAASESRLALALEAGRMGVWEWDIASGQVVWSPRLEQIHGLRPGSFPGTFEAVRRDMHPADRERVSEILKRTLEEGRGYHVQYRIIRPDGAVRWLEARGRALLDDEGVPVRMVGVCTDITERRDSEERLRQMNVLLERRVAERTDRLEQLSKQLRRLAAQLTEAEQRERRRIAELIHDHLQQLLVAARMRLASARSRREREAVEEQVGRVLEIIGEALRVARSLTIELRPPVLYEHGLPAALAWLADWMGGRHEFRVELDLDEAADPEDDRMRAFVFEAARELLFNVVKHSGVTEARLKLRRLEDGRISLLVEDQGLGFDPGVVDDQRGDLHRFGLFSMRERLKALGGRFELDTREGAGTRVRLSTPQPAMEVTEGHPEEELDRHIV